MYSLVNASLLLNRWMPQLQNLHVHRSHDIEGTGQHLMRDQRSRSNTVFSCKSSTHYLDLHMHRSHDIGGTGQHLMMTQGQGQILYSLVNHLLIT